jgi:hypothetical protein
MEKFIDIHSHFCVLILGVNSEFSNHHMYAKKVAIDFNLQHIIIHNLSDINYDLISEARAKGLVLSSDIIINHEVGDVKIFIETTEETLQKRGEVLELDAERWKKFKEKYPIQKYVYDNAPFVFKNAEKIDVTKSKTLQNIINFINEFIEKNI